MFHGFLVEPTLLAQDALRYLYDAVWHSEYCKTPCANKVLLCLSPAVLCEYRYPGYPGADCPTARKEMLKSPPGRWMTPKCNEDGSFQEWQCFDNPGPDDCMCVYRDGTLLSLPRRGENKETCICHVLSFEEFLINKEDRFMVCDSHGYFYPLQCSLETRKCWCVTKYGTVVAPPSADRKSCDDFAHLLKDTAAEVSAQ
ncbi:hypothetical protein AVEN_187672-1 [Araneus ventricosus]|uniref:Thyroglobulin type-1 domain-containing protein n=1 Tax=Araneus ventricosus TaxID=182803 RepID=A0A4Y2M646_ARAVE|nr:hypothetical protein AVEN_187672-1 [Araneus ventricosus]